MRLFLFFLFLLCFFHLVSVYSTLWLVLFQTVR